MTCTWGLIIAKVDGKRHFVVDTTYKLEKAMATHSSILAWKIPWAEEPSGLQFTGLQSRTGLTEHARTYLY